MNRIGKYMAITCTLVMMSVASSVFANFLVVTPDQVVANAEGLFVSINEIAIAVESLNVSNDGYIVAVPIPSLEADICPICRCDTYTPGRYCTTCGFPIWNKKPLE